MSKKNIPLDFKSPSFKQSLKVNPLKILAYQTQINKQSEKEKQETQSKPQTESSIPRHKNIVKPQPQKQTKQLPYKTKMCPLGRDCRKQLTCRFAHNQKELRKPFFKRTKPCLLYQRGMCSLGSACRQYHGNFDLKSWNQKNYKKVLCQDFQNGNCPKRQLCIYAHGKQQLEQYAQLQEQEPTLQKNNEAQKIKPIVIQLNSYKPNSYTMQIVEQNLGQPIQIGESFDLFNNKDN